MIKKHLFFKSCVLCALATLLFIPPSLIHARAKTYVRFAAIGDYGRSGIHEEEVANLVKNWHPDFIITLGDNNYHHGDAKTLKKNITQYYGHFIAGVGRPKDDNRFFPSPGNHDYDNKKKIGPYLDYFRYAIPKGPGQGRFYEFKKGAVHFFSLDSDKRSAAGITVNSIQARWLKKAMAKSTSKWKIVYMHHPPYSSGKHGPTKKLQWPFHEWGADMVMAGHDHTYERIEKDGVLYIINGVGGGGRIYDFKEILPESKKRYNKEYGALFMEATNKILKGQFIDVNDEVIDRFSKRK